MNNILSLNYVNQMLNFGLKYFVTLKWKKLIDLDWIVLGELIRKKFKYFESSIDHNFKKTVVFKYIPKDLGCDWQWFFMR